MTRPQAIALVLLGAVLMSLVGWILRLMDDATGFQILVYRSLSLAAMVMVFACLRRVVGPLEFLKTIDYWDVFVGVLLAFAFSFYVYALLATNIASALFILSCAPIVATILAWAIMGEKPTAITYAALGLAVVGVGLMVYDGFETGGWLGNFFALISATCFASMLVTIRATGKEDALGGTFLGGVFATLGNALILIVMGTSFVISQWDLALSLIMGAFTIGLGIAFVTTAASHLPASEVSILVLLESVLGPIWVWLFLNETTTFNVIIGGAIVLGAVVLQTLGGKKSNGQVA